MADCRFPSKCALRGIRCPTDHAIIERTHQTLTAQALLGQVYPSHSALWAELDARRDVLNRHLPSRALSHQSPLQAYPQAIHSGRLYRPEWEEEFLSLEKVYTYLAQCRWVRSIRPNGSFELGSYYYYMGHRFARRSVAIRFDPGSAALLCQPEGSEETLQLPVQGRNLGGVNGRTCGPASLAYLSISPPVFALWLGGNWSTLVS